MSYGSFSNNFKFKSSQAGAKFSELNPKVIKSLSQGHDLVVIITRNESYSNSKLG